MWSICDTASDIQFTEGRMTTRPSDQQTNRPPDDLDQLRHIEGFPIGEDEDLHALSEPPYYTTDDHAQ